MTGHSEKHTLTVYHTLSGLRIDPSLGTRGGGLTRYFSLRFDAARRPGGYALRATRTLPRPLAGAVRPRQQRRRRLCGGTPGEGGGPAGDADRLRRRTAFAAGSRSGPSGLAGHAGGDILPANSRWPASVSHYRRPVRHWPWQRAACALRRADRGRQPPFGAGGRARYSVRPAGRKRRGAGRGRACRTHRHVHRPQTGIADRPGARLGRATSSECARLIGLAGEATGTDSAAYRRGVAALAASRRPCAHKGEHGRLLLVGGDRGFGGAIRMAAEAALRSGAGLVRVLTHIEHVAPLLAARPELMAQALDEATLRQAMQWADVLVIGPGWARLNGAKRLERAANQR